MILVCTIVCVLLSNCRSVLIFMQSTVGEGVLCNLIISFLLTVFLSYIQSRELTRLDAGQNDLGSFYVNSVMKKKNG